MTNQFYDPPAGHRWCNPSRVTAEQVQLDEGWRLSTNLEAGLVFRNGQIWNGSGWTPYNRVDAPRPHRNDTTIRIKHPMPSPRPEPAFMLDPDLEALLGANSTLIRGTVRARYDVVPPDGLDGAGVKAWLLETMPTPPPPGAQYLEPRTGIPAPATAPAATPVPATPPPAPSPARRGIALNIPVTRHETRTEQYRITYTGDGQFQLTESVLRELHDEHDGDIDEIVDAVLELISEDDGDISAVDEQDRDYIDGETDESSSVPTSGYDLTRAVRNALGDLGYEL